jgi:hypothetical protein
MFLRLVVHHTNPLGENWIDKYGSWLYLLTSIVFILGLIVISTRPNYYRRYFLAGVFGASATFIYFVIILDNFTHLASNPVPYSYKYYFDYNYRLAYELWFLKETFLLISKHIELSVIPLIPVYCVIMVDKHRNLKTGKDSIPAEGPGKALPLKNILFISVLTSLVTGAMLWVLSGKGSNPEEQLIIVVTHDLEPGALISEKDVAVADTFKRFDTPYHKIESVIGRKTKSRLYENMGIFEEDLEPVSKKL